MVIYLDIIVGLNILFNFFILLLTNYLAKAGKKRSRILIGALFATIIVPIELLLPYSVFHTIGFKAVFSLIIILCTFGYNGLQTFMKRISLFYFNTFAIGGGLLGLHFMVQDMSAIRNNKLFLYVDNMYGDQISVVLLLAGFPVFVMFTKRRMDRHVKDKLLIDQMYEVSIELNGQCHKTTGYIDSGNQLVDPLTNRPVVICDRSYLQHFFSKEEWRTIEFAIQSNDVSHFPSSLQKRIFIVPYQGVGGHTGYLYTIKPDKLNVSYQNDELTTNKVLIGIQLANLTAENRYHCLLHPELIQLKMDKITA